MRRGRPGPEGDAEDEGGGGHGGRGAPVRGARNKCGGSAGRARRGAGGLVPGGAAAGDGAGSGGQAGRPGKGGDRAAEGTGLSPGASFPRFSQKHDAIPHCHGYCIPGGGGSAFRRAGHGVG